VLSVMRSLPTEYSMNKPSSVEPPYRGNRFAA